MFMAVSGHWVREHAKLVVVHSMHSSIFACSGHNAWDELGLYIC